eukprot:TRINITY_DN7156_c2_g1_i4.p2 TRINITY_DN7156_c2_g1~~TRINITY_DN7156_c2_g1_i4.p2  ORF type:complete len:299 (-),score=18.55 TRINITY_DN7156_c2_g1_i4:28-924(-)
MRRGPELREGTIMQKKTSVLAVGLLCSAGLAQSYGIVAFDRNDHSLNLVDVPDADPGQVSVANLFNFADTDTRILRIDRAPNGTFYMDNSPFPPTDPNKAGLLQVDDLFGTPNVSFLAQGDDRFSIGSSVDYDAARDQVFMMQIPSSTHQDPRYFGVIGVDPNNGSITNVYEEDRDNRPPRPRWQRGIEMVKDINSSDYLALAVNGGIFEDPNGPGDPPDRNFGSTLHRLEIDGNLNGTESLIVDLSDTSVTGLNRPINFARGIDINPDNGDVYIADGEKKRINISKKRMKMKNNNNE